MSPCTALSSTDFFNVLCFVSPPFRSGSCRTVRIRSYSAWGAASGRLGVHGKTTMFALRQCAKIEASSSSVAAAVMALSVFRPKVYRFTFANIRRRAGTEKSCRLTTPVSFGNVVPGYGGFEIRRHKSEVKSTAYCGAFDKC